MELFLSALGLAMIFEGIPYFAFPNQVKELAKRLPGLPNRVVRVFGLSVIAVGLFVIYIARFVF